MTETDLPMLSAWLAEPHVAEWWDDGPEASKAEIMEAMDDIATEPLIVELDGRPIAYIQSYDPHLEDDHPYQDQPTGTLGIDQFIGLPELVGIGHGSASCGPSSTSSSRKAARASSSIPIRPMRARSAPTRRPVFVPSIRERRSMVPH